MKLVMCVLLAGCWTGTPAKPPAEPARTSPPPDATPAISMVTSFVVIEACPNAKTLDTKGATREIEALVGPCKTVPGNSAHFSVTLQPDGRVTLASPTGDPAEGVVPTCVLETSAAFRHKVRVAKACRFDVKLEERRVR